MQNAPPRSTALVVLSSLISLKVERNEPAKELASAARSRVRLYVQYVSLTVRLGVLTKMLRNHNNSAFLINCGQLRRCNMNWNTGINTALSVIKCAPKEVSFGHIKLGVKADYLQVRVYCSPFSTQT